MSASASRARTAPLPDDVVVEARRLREGGLTYRAIAARTGASYPAIFKRLSAPLRTVPTAPLREAFLDSGMSRYELAKRLGWYQNAAPALRARGAPARVPSAVRVNMTLGIRHRCDTGRRTERMHRATAEQIAQALGLDPVDVGL